jgi:hypothetical protein
MVRDEDVPNAQNPWFGIIKIFALGVACTAFSGA